MYDVYKIYNNVTWRQYFKPSEAKLLCVQKLLSVNDNYIMYMNFKKNKSNEITTLKITEKARLG